MDARVYTLIDCLRTNDSVAPKSLAQSLGVTERTVRTYVNRANSALTGIAQIRHLRSVGYVLDVRDRNALSALLSRESASLAFMPMTPEGRLQYLVEDLVNRSDWIKVDDLANLLLVSSKTISNDLAKVEQVLSHHKLFLERKPHYGVRVVGSETSKRLCLASLAISSDRRPGALLQAPDMETMGRIESCVSKALELHGASVSSVALRGLITHLYVTLRRIRKSCLQPFDEELIKRMVGTGEYRLATEVVARLSREFEVEFPRQEIAAVSVLLACEQISATGGVPDDGLVVSEEVWGVIAEMLDIVRRRFRFDLHDDLELRMNLARHVVPLAKRLQYRMDFANPLLEEIRAHYPLAYLIALESSEVLVKHYGSMPSDDEVGFIALLFALALERKRAQGPKKNILVVGEAGPSGLALLSNRLRSEFGEHIGTISTCDVSELDSVEWDSVDYVFSTIPIKRTLPVPICQIRAFLDDDDIQALKGVVTQEPQGALLLPHFLPELFLAHRVFSGKDDLLGTVCSMVEQHEGIEQGVLLRSVLAREAAARTTFGNGVAIPHPIEPLGTRTVVATCLLDEPLDWDGADVRAVFLVSVTREVDESLRDFNRAMAKLVSSREAIEALVADQRFETLKSLLSPPTEVWQPTLGEGGEEHGRA